MPEMHLKQPGFTYNARVPFTKNKEFKNLKKQELQAIFTKMILIFQHDMVMEILKIYQEEQLLI